MRRLSAASEDIIDKENQKYFSKLQGINSLGVKVQYSTKASSSNYVKSDNKQASYPKGYFSKLIARGGTYPMVGHHSNIFRNTKIKEFYGLLSCN
jgi:hypothetical protein